MAFLIYWRIKAASTKTAPRGEPALLGVLRALAFLAVIALSSTTRIHCMALPSARAVSHLAVLDWSRCYGWRARTLPATGAATVTIKLSSVCGKRAGLRFRHLARESATAVNSERDPTGEAGWQIPAACISRAS
jgi:hypothetical protein